MTNKLYSFLLILLMVSIVALGTNLHTIMEGIILNFTAALVALTQGAVMLLFFKVAGDGNDVAE